MFDTLAYAANVHPSQSVAQLFCVVQQHASRIRTLTNPYGSLGVELRLGMQAIDAFAAKRRLRERFSQALKDQALHVFSVNGFPLRDFHAGRVKEQVYRPSWMEEARRRYTRRLAELFCEWLKEGETGTLSTVGGAFRDCEASDRDKILMAHNIADCARCFRKLFEDTGRKVVLCLEPEPFTTLETTGDAIAFFKDFLWRHGVDRLAREWGRGGAMQILREHVGLNYDCCHQAVLFEDPVDSLVRIQGAGVPVRKIHVSCALALKHPGDHPQAVKFLCRFAEPRYFHQTFAVDRRGGMCCRALDLQGVLALDHRTLSGFREIRSHFHVPVFLAAMESVQTTQDWTKAALSWIRRHLDCAHFVVETYTWGVMADLDLAMDGGAGNWAEGIARELQWTGRQLSASCDRAEDCR